jgi:hypothetical protein
VAAKKLKQAREVALTDPNGQADRVSCTSLTVPDELIPFSEPSSLLPGESLHDFEVLQRMMVDDIVPQTNIEWLWTLDLFVGNLAVPSPQKQNTGSLSGSRDRSYFAATGR